MEYAVILRICLERLHQHPAQTGLSIKELAEVLADWELKQEEER